MLIRLGYELGFNLPAPLAMNLMLYMHPSRQPTVRRPDALKAEMLAPDGGEAVWLPIETFIDSFGNSVGRINAPAGKLRLTNDALVQDTGLPDEQNPAAVQHTVGELPHDVLQYLLASRYCEVDAMSDIAWELFGQTPLGWARVQAVVGWVHRHVTFGYAYARSTKTAYDVYMEKKGVCRDFQHLSITFCRALNIPARYTTGYLGDIGVPAVPCPMDFSAWFEAYLGGRWWTFDARHNKPRIGRVLMAAGRDATDVALTTSFGPSQLEKFVVVTDEVNGF